MSNNFTSKAEKALNRAVGIAEDLGHTYIGTEHVLTALAEDETSCAAIILKKHKIDKDVLYKAIKEYTGLNAKSKLNSKDTTPKCRKVLENSYKITKKYDSEKIGTEHLLLAIIEESECVASKILIKIKADSLDIKNTIIQFLRSSQRSIVYGESVNDANIPNLLKYGKNITALAERGLLDPVIGRETETNRLIRILSRKNKNNPCLIGEAGVGKTAIVEGLAERIVTGRVPESLLNKIIISVDLTSMVAGAKYRGDFEERIKSIMTEVARNKSIILFIDEIHTIVGAGSAEGAIDAANIMKPELSRGEIQIIGATTLAEYHKYIEKDSALERRFQPIIVEEPTVEKTIDILLGIKSNYEKHHNVTISTGAIEAAVRLSERYIQDRFLPDKAIDILDEACASTSIYGDDANEKVKNIKENIQQNNLHRKVAIEKHDYELAANLKQLDKIYNEELSIEINEIRKTNKTRNVEIADVERIVSEITGIDFSEHAKREISGIQKKLSDVVIGQSNAIKHLADAVMRSNAGINSPDKPKGIFLFLGESGVGKTELAKALAQVLFKSENALIRFDMSEFTEGSAVSKLIGSAPGYVGYDEQSSAFEKIRKRPYSVILLDEIDKAHPDILSLFLQIFDTGTITDASGRKINFKNAYIIMTSNLSSDKIRGSNSAGFMVKNTDQGIRKKINGLFKDEFVNRIDEILLFDSLSASALKEIAKLKIFELSNRLSYNNINIVTDSEVYDYLANEAIKNYSYGARALNRVIVSCVENELAAMILENEINEHDVIKIKLEENKIKCVKACLSVK